VAALLLGIVFLMTTKPSLTGALIVMAIALLLGLASGVLASRATVIPEQSEAPQSNRTSRPAG